MPRCFQLISKETKQPEALAAVDDKICAFLGVEPDDVKYVAGWYDTIGLMIAMGLEKEDIFERIETLDTRETLKRVAQFIFDNYNPIAFYSMR